MKRKLTHHSSLLLVVPFRRELSEYTHYYVEFRSSSAVLQFFQALAALQLPITRRQSTISNNDILRKRTLRLAIAYRRSINQEREERVSEAECEENRDLRGIFAAHGLPLNDDAIVWRINASGCNVESSNVLQRCINLTMEEYPLRKSRFFSTFISMTPRVSLLTFFFFSFLFFLFA